MRKANAPATPKRSARGAEESELAAPVLSGRPAERVAVEIVPLWLPEGTMEPETEAVPVGRTLETMLVSEADAETDEAE